MVIGELTSAGYVCIGMDHFARPGDELAAALKEGTLHRNFQGYTTKGGCDLFGVGATSISQFSNVYSQNIKDAPRYIEAAVSGRSTVMRGIELTGEDLLRRDVINGLMCRSEVRKNEIEEKHGIEFDMFFKDELENLAPMEKDGLVSLSRYKLEVKPLGRLLVRNIAMVFDAYLNRAVARLLFRGPYEGGGARMNHGNGHNDDGTRGGVRKGVLLLNYGGPRNEAEVFPFLQEIFGDPALFRYPAWIRKRLARHLAARRTPVTVSIYGEMVVTAPSGKRPGTRPAPFSRRWATDTGSLPE